MRDCTFGVWHTNEAAALFEYLQSTRATARPLILAGFDIQRSGLRADFDRPAQIRQAVAPFDSVLAEQVAAVDQEFITSPDLAGFASANVDRVGPLYTRLAALIAAHAVEIDAALPNRPGFAAALEASVRWTPTFMDVLRRGSTDPAAPACATSAWRSRRKCCSSASIPARRSCSGPTTSTSRGTGLA